MNQTLSYDTYERERMHDLLNYLSAAYLTVSYLDSMERGRKEILRAKESMRECIAVARSCFIKNKSGIFVIENEINKVLKILEYFAKKSRVNIHYSNRTKKSIAKGDNISFRRALTNVIKNAIEASAFSKKKTVMIKVECVRNTTVITVTDSGKGLQKKLVNKVGFEKISTKQTVRGFGVLSTKRIIENNYGGSFSLQNNTKKNGAICTISLKTA